MFLATTALDDFCDRSGPVLYLGAWSVPWATRPSRMRPADVVMPSVWDDRARFYQAAQYADACAERLLSRLGTYLNDVHAERRDPRYWRIVIGAWLTHYVHATYDRWVHLKAALGRSPGLTTMVLDPASYLTPRSGTEMLAWLVDDAYNLQLCSQLLAAMGLRFTTRMFDAGLVRLLRRDAIAAGLHQRAARRITHMLERALIARLQGRVGITGVPIPFAERWRVAVATRGDVVPVAVAPEADASFAGPDAVFDVRRCGLAGLEATDSFERAIVDALPVNFPSLYLEGHQSAGMAARSALRRVHVRAWLTETDWYANDRVRYMAAEAAEKGVTLVAAQHGGGYGVYRFSPGELHEKRIADRYLVWGWAADEQPLRNWPSMLLSRTAHSARHVRVAPAGLLLVATTQSRYLHMFNSQPAGTQLEDYFGWQARFLATLPPPLHRVATVRPHSIDYGQAAWPRIAARFPDVARDGAGSFVQAMRQRQLVVIDHCGTALLETFAVNVPTVLFWDPARWELRPAAEPFFDELRRVGVLHDDPEQAARHVSHVYDRAGAWWQGADIQAARRRFVERFAFHRPGGAIAWADGLADAVTCA